jgi:enhancing lycopene biosynthesis protein 2
MPKRVAVVLSGCGALDGSEVREAVLTLLSLERGGAEVYCAAPADVVQRHPVDHRTGGRLQGTRSVIEESARIARAQLRDLSTITLEDADAIVIPGGNGVGNVLSNYDDKGTVCDVHPELVRLLKAHLASHRPMGFISQSPILAARVLGPVAGVRITLGPRGSTPAKHAAVMGADVRPCQVRDILVDQKARVISTPGYMYDDARLVDVAVGIDKLVRQVLSLAKDRHPLPPPEQQPGSQQPGSQQQKRAG